MVIDDPAQNCLIRIPVDGRDAEVMQLVESLPVRFLETGLRISTGPIVLFRAKEFLVEEPQAKVQSPCYYPITSNH